MSPLVIHRIPIFSCQVDSREADWPSFQARPFFPLSSWPPDFPASNFEHSACRMAQRFQAKETKHAVPISA
jgi:hypothetical protein